MTTLRLPAQQRVGQASSAKGQPLRLQPSPPRLVSTPPQRGLRCVATSDSSSGDAAGLGISRRGLLAGAAGSAALSAGGSPSGIILPGSAPALADSLPLVPKADLFPGCNMITVPSSIIKGCWQLSGGHKGEKDTDRTSGQAALADFGTFVDAGVNTFDTGPEACGYGQSERIIGDYMRKMGGKDQEVHVFTKFCCVGQEMRNLTRDYVTQYVDRPLGRLGVDKIDNLQLYWNSYGAPEYVLATQYMAEEQAKGKIVDIGLTNFDVPRIQDMVAGGATIASNQIQYSLLDRRPENGMVEYCRSSGVALVPYGVVAGGFLSDRYLGVDAKEININTYSKQKYTSVIRKAGGWDWFQDLLQALRAVADGHGVTIADVATRWVLEKDVVPAVIVGARNANHVDDHRVVSTFSLTPSDYDLINEALDKGTRPKGDCYTWERGGVW